MTTEQLKRQLEQAEKERRRRRVEVHNYNAAGPVPNKKRPQRGDWRKEVW